MATPFFVCFLLHYFCNQKYNVAIYFRNCFLFKYWSFSWLGSNHHTLVLTSKVKLGSTGFFPLNFFLEQMGEYLTQRACSFAHPLSFVSSSWAGFVLPAFSPDLLGLQEPCSSSPQCGHQPHLGEDCSGSFRTVPDCSGLFWTVLDSSGLFQTAPDCS